MSALELQKAIYSKLSTDLTVSVLDNVPSGTPYPYVVIGDDTLNDSSTDDFIGFQATVTIHSWTDSEGRKQVKTIQQSIFDSLNRCTLSISGFNFVSCTQEYSETMLEADGITRHGIQRFRVLYDKS